MKTKVAGIFFICSMFAGFNANAAAPANWYESVTLTNVFAGKVSGRVAINVTPGINVGTCPSGEMTLDQASPYFKAMYTMIMIAYSTKSSISVYTDGTCSQYGVNLTDVRVQ